MSQQGRLPWEEKEVDAAAYAAGAIGGRAGDENVDPAERPLQEAGEGEAEGFELAEEDLVESAETGLTWVEPVQAAFPAESEDGSGAIYGEADHELSSELVDDGISTGRGETPFGLAFAGYRAALEREDQAARLDSMRAGRVREPGSDRHV